MQVLSSRSNQSERSNSYSKNNKKGLSLTSRSKCNSLPKPSHNFLQDQTIETDLRNNHQTQISIKFNSQNHNQQSSFFSVPQNCQSHLTYQNRNSYIPEKPVTQKPKITFRYSNDHNSYHNQYTYHKNPFLNNQSEPLHPSQVRSRLLPCQQVRNVVVTKSIETKNAYPMTNVIQKKQNVNKILIDSRCIDREIIQQQVYQPFSIINQNVPSLPQITVNPPKIQNKPQQILKILKIQHNHKDTGFLQQYQSPYHLLISTAKKCESKQLSPSLFQQNQVIEFNKSKNLPKICQFQINQIVFEEHQQESPSSSPIFNKVQDVRNQQQQNKKYEILKEPAQLSEKTQDQTKILKIHSINNVQESQHLFNKNLVERSPQKVIEVKTLQKSPKKVLKKNLSKKVLQDIENRPPESHTNSAISGRRNIKRFKQIEKRLQEIITICGKNL